MVRAARRAAAPRRERRPGAPLLFHAIGLAEWHWATRFCPRCGGALEPRKAGHELVCTVCGKPQFPRTDPAVIMVVADGEPGSDDERCLLGRQAAWPEGRYSTLAGFCEPGETLEDAVRREVAEEVGVRVGEVELLRQPALAAAGQPDAGLRRPRRDHRHRRRRRGDRGRAVVHPRRRCGPRPRPAPWSCRAASRSPGRSSSTGTAARSRAAGDPPESFGRVSECGQETSCRASP